MRRIRIAYDEKKLIFVLDTKKEISLAVLTQKRANTKKMKTYSVISISDLRKLLRKATKEQEEIRRLYGMNLASDHTISIYGNVIPGLKVDGREQVYLSIR